MKIGPIDKSKLANTDQEYINLLYSDADWIARTADDVRQLRKDSPFAKLPESDFQEFLNRLEFKNGGLAHGYYKPLMSSLTLTEIFEMFERFGMSPELFVRYRDMACNGDFCEFAEGLFCSIACGSLPPANGPR